MSDTITDFAKVTQMLDAGWTVQISKNGMGSYTASGQHQNLTMIETVNRKIAAAANPSMRSVVEEFQDHDQIDTDDFTPEQALTRLAYKAVDGIII